MSAPRGFSRTGGRRSAAPRGRFMRNYAHGFVSGAAMSDAWRGAGQDFIDAAAMRDIMQNCAHGFVSSAAMSDARRDVRQDFINSAAMQDCFCQTRAADR